MIYLRKATAFGFGCQRKRSYQKGRLSKRLPIKKIDFRLFDDIQQFDSGEGAGVDKGRARRFGHRPGDYFQ